MPSCNMYVSMKDPDKQVETCNDFNIQMKALLINLNTISDFYHFTTISNKIIESILCVIQNVCNAQLYLIDVVKNIIKFEKNYKNKLDMFILENQYKKSDLIIYYKDLYIQLFFILLKL